MAKHTKKKPPSDAMTQLAKTVEGAMEHPDEPLAFTGLNIPRDVLDQAPPSKMFADGGAKMKVVSDICSRGLSTPFPTTPAAVREYYAGFMEYCMEWRTPPTLSLFSLWCGTTVNGYNRHMRLAQGSDLGHALEECKESLRAFIEVSAMAGEVDKLLYFHQQKGYYDVVEKVEIKHDVDIREHEMTEAEIDAVIGSLPTVEYEEVEE